MSPEHTAELVRRGIVYTPNPRASQDYGHPCIDACGVRVSHPRARCGRCKLALVNLRTRKRAARLERQRARGAQP